MLPDLPIRASAKWLEKLHASFMALGAAVPNDTEDASLFDLNRLTTEAAVDLIVAFDEMGETVLGGRDWIEANASQSQIHETLDTLREVSIPFGADVEAMTLTRLLVRAAALNAQSSMSGLLPTGDSRPTPLRPRSQRRSSPISGRKARSA